MVDFLKKIWNKLDAFGIILFGALVFFLAMGAYADDNHVHVEQVNGGDSTDLTIDQIGFDNLIRFSFDHQNNTIELFQQGNNQYIGYTDAWGSGYNWGGDLDGYNNDVLVKQKCSASSCNENDFQFHIWGHNNEVVFGQGYEIGNSLSPTWSYDGNEPGGNFVRLDIHGDYNDFKGSQKQDSDTIEHSMTWNIYGDHNDVYSKQMQNGDKTLTGQINNDYNTVSTVQKKNGAHTANITLSGTEGTTLNLTQTGNTAQSYTLSQTCYTTGGCTVNVSQGN